MKENIAFTKAKKFSLRIVKLSAYLHNVKKEKVIADQIKRSGTSIGANLSESECASSKNDFVAKVYIALKECSETIYWLELLRDSKIIKQEEFDSMFADCNEIKKILMATTKTMRKNTE